uniref:Uncharacterized protein n=1 Tax=Arion vulgaris TaxID=1028688 RepID=A0A0B7B2G2_9EUPU
MNEITAALKKILHYVQEHGCSSPQVAGVFLSCVFQHIHNKCSTNLQDQILIHSDTTLTYRADRQKDDSEDIIYHLCKCKKSHC